MRIASVNVSSPREAVWNGRRVRTGIFKRPVDGPVTLRTFNLDGDRQADLRVHGGPSKAVYAYALDHYAYWRQEFPDMTLSWGIFGENLTGDWPPEDAVNVGDRFRIGSAEVMATEPRLPCYKLGVKFGRRDIIKRFLASGRTGFYFAVVREGMVRAGDLIEPVVRDTHGITIADITRLYTRDGADRDLLARAAELPALSEAWRGYFQEQVERLSSRPSGR
jgi:MOSC domain-containing protein YiiM